MVPRIRQTIAKDTRVHVKLGAKEQGLPLLAQVTDTGKKPRKRPTIISGRKEQTMQGSLLVSIVSARNLKSDWFQLELTKRH